MQTIALDNTKGSSPDTPGVRCSVLGFGCSAVMGRVGRKASLAALSAAYDAGITFFDTARSYGYGESESLLGEFLHGRRSSVLISTKFGILPAPASPFRRRLKPLARTLLHVAPGARRLMQPQLAAQSSAGHFSVAALHASLHASLRALRTDYVDFLFLHEPPASVLQQEDLFAALDQLVTAGKVRRIGIACSPQVAEAALAARLPGLQSVQLACNLFDLDAANKVVAAEKNAVIIGNHPFGGAAGVAAARSRLRSLADAPDTPQTLQEKLRPADDALIADVVLNLITRDAGVQVVTPSMLQLDHLRANVAAIEHSRFSDEELPWLRAALSTAQAPKATYKA